MFDNYLLFQEPGLREDYRILSANDSMYFPKYYREVHFCRIFPDQVFGREFFLKKIIRAYDYTAGSKKKRPAPKHDYILVHDKNPEDYFFQPCRNGTHPLHVSRAGLTGENHLRKESGRNQLLTILPANGREITSYPPRNHWVY